MSAKKPGDNGQNVHTAEDNGRSNDELTPRFSILTAQRALGIIEFIERDPTPLEISSAFRRQSDRAGCTPQQRDSERLFQVGDGTACRRRRDSQPSRRFSKAPVIGDCDKCL
jgi:hypothetical protein